MLQTKKYIYFLIINYSYQDNKYNERLVVVLHLAESGKPIEKNIIDLSKLRIPKSLKKTKKEELKQYDSCKAAKDEADESLLILGPDGKKMKCE